jgi:hypothetical protein
MSQLTIEAQDGHEEEYQLIFLSDYRNGVDEPQIQFQLNKYDARKFESLIDDAQITIPKEEAFALLGYLQSILK